MTESGNPGLPADVNVNAASYDASHIHVLEGIEAIRKRPGMYVGSTTGRGLHHLVYEAVLPSFEEALAGHADTIDVTITADGGVRVTDNGRGIPVAVATSGGRPALEVLLTRPNTGDGRTGYPVNGGLNGVGPCVVNALSKHLTAEVRHGGAHWTQEYTEGIPLAPPARHGKAATSGTTITFWADAGIFETTRYSFTTLAQRFEEMAFLTKGLAISLTDERPEHTASDNAQRTVRYQYEGGARDFVAQLASRPGKPVHPTVISLEGQDQDRTMSVEVALQWNTRTPDTVLSFANTTRTHEGGTHEDGLRNALTDLLTTRAQEIRPLSRNDTGHIRDTVLKGLTAVIAVKHSHPRFEGATRTRLANTDIRAYVEDIVREQLTHWLNAHPHETAAIIRHTLTATITHDTDDTEDESGGRSSGGR